MRPRTIHLCCPSPLIPSLPVRLLLAAFLFLIWTATMPARAQQTTARPANNNLIARGKYLVENVAMCTQCHTPRDSSGKFDRTQWLQGGPLFYQPAHSVADWPLQVPRIGGSVAATDAELVTLLTTGIWRDGKRLRQPMQQFRMTPEDASAVVVYLRSLNPSSPAQQEPR